MCTTFISRAAAVSIAACIVSSAIADPPCFRGLGVGAEYGQSVDVTGMSADGTVVVGIKANPPVGWRWIAGEGFPHMPGFSQVREFHGVSGDGRSVVGRMIYDYPTIWHPMRWTAGVGGMWLSVLPDSPGGQANAVSADGLTIVGHVGGPGAYHAFRWDPIGGIQSLGTLPGGDESKAFGASGDGLVAVGGSRYEGGNYAYQAFRWTHETGMVGLGFLPDGDASSCAYAISADGTTIVGVASGAEGGDEAFRWTEAGGMVGLGTLPDDEHSQALAVSVDGSVVVGSSHGAGSESPFIWNVADGMRNFREILEHDYGMNLTDWYLSRVQAVSADGTMIAGKGSYQGNSDAWVARIVPVTGTCPGDLDYDGDVDLTDLSLLLASYGEGSTADLDCDCVTDLSDLSVLLANYGTTCE